MPERFSGKIHHRATWLSVAAVLCAAAVTGVYSQAQTTQPAAGGPGEPAAPPVRPNDRAPGGLMDRAAESNVQVYVDDSFASVDKLRKALKFANEGQSQLAISEFQGITDQYGQKLVYLNDNSYVSITDYVREKLLQVPAVRQGMYDQLYGGEAQKAVDAAIQGRDAATLIRVCDRYFPSTAAMAGLEQAAQWYFERGEFAPASRTWQLLMQHPQAGKKQAELLFRAALAETLAQNPTAADALRDRLEKEFPDATGTFYGEEVKLLTKLGELAKMPPWDAVDLSREDWPAFEGGPSRSRLLNVSATIGARLWSVALETAPLDPSSPDYAIRRRLVPVPRGVPTGDADALGMNSFVVMANGTLFLHTGDRVVALSANAGAPLWAYPPLSTARPTGQERTLSIPSMMRTTAHDSVSVFGDSVFAVMSGMDGFVDPRIMQQIAAAGGASNTSRVVCIQRDDGTERWSCTANEIKLDTPQAPAGANPNAANVRGGFTFVGSPMVTRQGVFIMARRVTDASFSQQYLVRLDRQTGSVTWACYLCSTSSGAMYGYPYASAGSIAVPSLVDDVLYVSTGQGADCAVDANIGRILWLRVVDNGQQRATGDFYRDVTTYVPAWKYNPPLIVRDSMIVADNGVVRVYDRWTGKLRNTLRTADLGLTRLDVLAGVVNDHLVLSGDRKTVYLPVSQLEKAGAKSFKSDWQVEVPSDAGRAQGRPFLTTAKYYIPFEKKLIQVDLTSGKSNTWDWPNTEKDVPGKPGNLLVTSEQVVVINDSEIAGYSDWDTAKANREAKIAQNPKDPRRYLDLAEIGFRTEHYDIARDRMKSSVELANEGGDTGPGGSNAEVLTRLYRTNLNFAEQLLAKADAALRDQSRFYFEQCRGSARDPEQQAEWRLRLAELSLKQKRPEEAATLYSEVLVDPALRVANYRESDVLASAGATAEQRIRKLVAENGPEVYRRFEDQATGLLEKAVAGRDLGGLQLVMEGYPNSKASVRAATELATACAQKQDWQAARRVLWWLVPRIQGEAQARAIADLVNVCVGLKKYASASAWANRGMSQFKDLSFTGTDGQKTTFADIRKKVAAAGVPDADGRLPHWLGSPTAAPPMETTPLDDSNLLSGRLLVPIETSPAYRQPNLLFLKKNDTLRVYDTAKGADAFAPVKLPGDQACVLLGISGQKAVLLQKDQIIGVDLKTQRVWAQPIRKGESLLGVPTLTNEERAQLPANLRGGLVRIGPNTVVIGADGLPMEDPGNRGLQGGGDAEVARRSAILSLDNPTFSSARLLNNKVLLVSGNTLTAFNVEDGQSAWRDRENRPISVRLPVGRPVSVVGNEDVIVAQVDAADVNNPSSTFLTIDADTGQSRRTIRLKSDRALWRALGDDGRLFVVSTSAVAAYDLVGSSSEQETPLWRRTDIQTRFANASTLTLDALMLVDNSLNVWCLSLESGELRWPGPERIPLTSPGGTITTLRSTQDGDNVIFQANLDAVAYRSSSRGTDQFAWKAYYPANTPALQAIQVTDLHVVELAMGPLNNTERAVKVIFRDRRGAKIVSWHDIVTGRGGAADRAGPMLGAWQVMDNGIALLVGDQTHFWRNIPEKDGAKEEPKGP